MYIENDEKFILSKESLIGKSAIDVYQMFIYIYEVYKKTPIDPVRVYDTEDNGRRIEPDKDHIVESIKIDYTYGIIQIYAKRTNKSVLTRE